MAGKASEKGGQGGGSIGPCFRAWKGFGGVLGSLGASWAPSWTYVEAMLATKPSKKQVPKHHQKNTEKTSPRRRPEMPGNA